MELLTVVYTVVALYICAHTRDIQYAVTDELGHVMQQDSVWKQWSWKNRSFSDEALKCKTWLQEMLFFSTIICCTVFVDF